ncbi:hypothetical protein [Streptomyces nigrescens]
MRQPAFVGSSITTRGGDAKAHDRMLPVTPIELTELLLGASQADLETFDLAEPAFRLGFGDSGDQAVADLGKPCSLGGVRSEERASDARVLMNAWGPDGACAASGGMTIKLNVPCRLDTGQNSVVALLDIIGTRTTTGPVPSKMPDTAASGTTGSQNLSEGARAEATTEGSASPPAAWLRLAARASRA